MPLTIKQLPKSERPYEKAKMYGFSNLSNSELLAIIIKSGTHEENSLDVSKRVLALVNNLNEMENLSIVDLQKVKGIGEVKSVQIKAIFELTKRINKPTDKEEIKLTKPRDVANLLNENPAQTFKTLVTVAKSNNHYVFVIPVECELDLKKAAKAVGEKNVEMIKQKELLPLCTFKTGTTRKKTNE